MNNKYFFRSLLIILAICFGCNAEAQRKKVGLVLGGGGAKGAAEVGVLKVLEEAKIPIDYIVGTSIGSIVGGMYSIGYSPQALDSMFRTQDWIFLLSDQVKRKDMSAFSKEEQEKYLLRVPLGAKQKSPLSAGLVTGQNIYNLFTNMTIGYHDVKSFMDLPIPFSCIAVDIVSGKEIVLSSGSLPLAMRSSMSIPGVFSPVEMGNMLLIDGGALNNFPTDVVKKMGADIIIGIDLSTGWKTKDDLDNLPNVVSQLINIMGENKYLQNKNTTDLYINPQLKGYGPASFQKEAIDSMIVRGEKAARDKWDDIIALRKKIYAGCDESTVQSEPTRKPVQHLQSFKVDSIKMEGVNADEEKWIRKKIKLSDNSEIKISDIDNTISFLQGLNIFSSVEYKLSDSTPCNLTLILKEKDYKSINVGIRFDTEDIASILVNASNEKKLASENHYDITGRLSKNPYIRLSYHYGNYFNPKFGVTYYLGYSDYKLYSHKEKTDVLNYLTQSISAYLTRSVAAFSFKLGAQYDFYHFEGPMYDEQYQPVRSNKRNFINYFTDLSLDTYDNKYYPMRGGKVELQGTIYTVNGATYKGHSPVASFSGNAQTAIKLNTHFYFLPSVKGRFIFANNLPCIYQNYLGGVYDGKYLPQELPWETVLYTHIVNRNVLATKMALRYQFKTKFFFTAIGEYGKDDRHFNSILKGHDLWGYALRGSYNSILGPVGIQVNYSNLYKNVGVYINAGLFF